MSPSYHHDPAIVPPLPQDEQQKAWMRAIRFVFADTFLSELSNRQMITANEYQRLSLLLEERCSMPKNSIFRRAD